MTKLNATMETDMETDTLNATRLDAPPPDLGRRTIASRIHGFLEANPGTWCQFDAPSQQMGLVRIRQLKVLVQNNPGQEVEAACRKTEDGWKIFAVLHVSGDMK